MVCVVRAYGLCGIMTGSGRSPVHALLNFSGFKTFYVPRLETLDIPRPQLVRVGDELRVHYLS